MKHLLFSCLLGMLLISVPFTANADGKTKAVSSLVKKLAGKAGKGAKGVKTKPTKSRTFTPRPRVVTRTCSTCNGTGKVTTWNSYYGTYQTSTCLSCSGTGKKR